MKKESCRLRRNHHQIWYRARRSARRSLDFPAPSTDLDSRCGTAIWRGFRSDSLVCYSM